ncbi:hypothetical protein ACE1AT_09575 [Pelatocladus sp. BLCC-F211]|uniref:COG1470 family protein n=1 Tax=Pelatocladus sp. BLCC-F211 TaxID=3342752 RepID=UPI0035BA633A
MYSKSSPLKVIINPPGIQNGMPGDMLELHVVVMNQGDQSALIDLFFDEAFQNFTCSNISPRERVALASQQSTEVSFQFQIPVDKLPGTYDYTLIVDAPEHYPQDTPIQYPGEIKVLLKQQTVIREHDPTFSLQPTTNPSNPLIYKLGETLQVVVTVDNRSRRVDRFRLTCPDLEAEWFTIRYPTTGLEGVGLFSGTTALELNPSEQRQIWLQFHPPADALAGTYSPTIRLFSENSPDLVLLDLVYIQIPPAYHLDIELNTILGKISYSPGKYTIKLANPGNTLRQLALSAKTQEEEELCTYEFIPNQVRLLPSKSTVVNLAVTPNSWWRRPLFGAGLVINFQLEIQDQQELPLPEKLPQGTLIWKARPWWQFLLLILVILGIMTGIGLIVWKIFNPEPLKLEDFGSREPRINEGDRVLLNWRINNFEQLQKLVLTTKGSVPTPPRELSLEELRKENTSGDTPCKKERQVLICTNYKTEAKEPGKYTFELKAFSRRKNAVTSQTTEVEIVAKPEPEIISFQSNQPTYENNETILLNWTIKYLEKLAAIRIIAKADNGTISKEKIITYEEINQTGICPQEKQQLTCNNFSIDILPAGNYNLQLITVSKSKQQPSSSSSPINIKVLPKPLKIVYFTLNGTGTEEPSRVLQVGENLTVSWKVEGEEDIQVELTPYGTVPPEGSKQIQVTQVLPPQITLTATDKHGQKESKVFSIQVEPTVESTPEVNDQGF